MVKLLALLASFQGTYDFGPCTVKGGPIWSDGLPGSFVQIDHKIEYSRAGAQKLDLMRAHPRSPIALGWSIEDIDAGPQERGGSTWESRTIGDDGVYGELRWNNEGNTGWGTMSLKKTAAGVEYEFKREDGREEQCELKLRPVQLPVPGAIDA